MEPESSLPHWQQTATCSWPEPDWSSLGPSLPPTHFSKVHFNINLPSMPGYSKWSPSITFPTRTLNALLLAPIRATCPAHLRLLHLITRIILYVVYRAYTFLCRKVTHARNIISFQEREVTKDTQNQKSADTDSTPRCSQATREICNSFSLKVDLPHAFSAKDRLRPDNVGTVSTGREGGQYECVWSSSEQGLPAAHRLSTARLSQESHLEAPANYLSQEHYIKRRADIQMGSETCSTLIIHSNLCFVG